MRLPDPYALKLKETRETVVFSASQRLGKKIVQEDYFLNFNDECFVVSDGLHSLPNGDVAAKFAAETAIWAFKHVRQHRYYWLDKKLFMKRIFRSTNLAVWQKRREAGFEEGLATSLAVLIVGAKQYWLGVSGDVGAWLIRGSTFRMLTPEASIFGDGPNRYVGIRRLGLVPYYKTGPLDPGSVIILASSGCANYVTQSDLVRSASAVGSTIEDATRAVTGVLTSAEINGSEDNMTALIVKRIDRN